MNCNMPSCIVLMWLTVVLTACGSIADRRPAPEPVEQLAEIPGIPNARFWGDAVTRRQVVDFESSTAEELRAKMPGIVGVSHYYLAISGGGSDGAFGAGLLNGWTAAGTRPEFTMVTGISTGALIAPFAFLGSKYDPVLEEIYTRYSTKDLIETRYWTVIATGDAVADTHHLRQKIYYYLTPQLIAELAQAFEDGRRLFIGTTNLDARRPVIWNVTAIAASAYRDKRSLITDILLASVSMPGVFPPVLFNVEWNGERYDELHVDGGAVSQVFVYPTAFDWPSLMKVLEVQGRPQVYVIRNSPLHARWSPISAGIFSIVGASVSSLIRTQGIGDIDRIYLTALRDGNDFHLAYLPDSFDMESTELFDQAYMRALYDLGYDMAKNGYPWLDKPVDFEAVKVDVLE